MMLLLRDFILPGLAAFVIGAVVGVYTDHAFIVACVVGLIGCAGFAIALPRNLRLLAIGAVCLLAAGGGCARGAMARNALACPLLCARAEQTTTLTGVVSDEPEERADKQRFTLRLDDAESKGEVLVDLPRVPMLAYGDHVRVFGKLHAPTDFTTETGATVRYAAMLRARGIVMTMTGDLSAHIGPNEGSALLAKLLHFKFTVVRIAQNLPSPRGALLASMIFGGKGALPKSVQDDFRIAGVTHIIVLSGENLTVVAALAAWFVSRRIGFYSGLGVSAVVVCAYAAMGGIQASTLRALVVALLLLFSKLVKRQANFVRIFWIALLVLVVMNPLLLLDDPSFQLAAIALGGVLFVGPIVEDIWLRHRLPIGMASVVGAIVGAQCFLFPYLTWSAQAMTSYALIANCFVFVIIETLSIGGILLVAIGALAPPVFLLAALPVSFCLGAILWSAHVIAALPGAYVPMQVSGTLIGAIYGACCIALYVQWRRPSMLPLARFTLREEARALTAGHIPWMPPEEASTAPLEAQEGVIDWA